MTDDIELLPLPEPNYKWMGYTTREAEAIARANVAHATEPLKAEIEALRAEVRELRKRQAGWERHVAAAGCEYVRDGEHDALVNRRAERLAEALLELCNVIDGHEVPVAVEGKAAHARAALRDHDQEVING